ncbi:MAG: DedA family protein [Rhodobacteraceae bacterium]|nr:DedA family protein [Paracoccaceae bacterium]
MDDVAAYLGLFGLAFLAATILPAQSEFGLVGLMIGGYSNLWALIAVASAGNTLGSVVNWGLGRGVERFKDRKWFPASSRQLDHATRWYHKYGRWSLLLSWMPFIGDPLTLAAGVLREPFWSFLALVAVAKTTRYVVVAGLALNWI